MLSGKRFGDFIATFTEKSKIKNISQTIRDRAISSEFFDQQGSTRVSYAKWKKVW